MKSVVLTSIVFLNVATLGCGSNEPPPQSTDPAAIERENTEGKKLRDRLESGEPEK